MVRLILAFAFAALTVLSVLSLDAHLAGVRAGDLADCNKGSGDTAIGGCSRLIESITRLNESKRRLFGGELISEGNLAKAYYNRGIAYEKKGEYDRAIADYDTAIKLNPKNATAYNNRGIAYSKKGEYDRAIADYDTAIKLNPNYAMTYSNRGVAYDGKGQYDRAIADYDMAIKLNPKYARAYNNRGNAYEKKGDRDKAIADYRKVLELRLGDEMATSGLKRLGVTP